MTQLDNGTLIPSNKNKIPPIIEWLKGALFAGIGTAGAGIGAVIADGGIKSVNFGAVLGGFITGVLGYAGYKFKKDDNKAAVKRLENLGMEIKPGETPVSERKTIAPDA